MITRITLDNMYSKGGIKEFRVPSKLLLNRDSEPSEWYNFGIDEVKILKNVKEIFRNDINLICDFKYDSSKESTLEIQMKWEEKTYTYSMVFCDSQLVMESLLEEQTWIFSRMRDNPDFALDPTFLNDKGEKCYEHYKDTFPASLLFCFKPGEELLKEIRDIIVVDEWMNMGYQDFIREFDSTFPDLSYNRLANEMIHRFGFSDEYERLDKDNETLIFSKNPSIKIRLETSGSGFLRLCRLYPLMVASKTKRLMMIAADPYDYCLHPILGEAVMRWFLKDNPIPPIGKLINIVL